MPILETENVSLECLQELRVKNDASITRVIIFLDVLLGQRKRLPWAKIPKIFTLSDLESKYDLAERKERIREAKIKIRTSTLPLLRLRERQIGTAIRGEREFESFKNLVDMGRVSPALLELAKEDYWGLIDNLFQPIRPLEKEPEIQNYR